MKRKATPLLAATLLLLPGCFWIQGDGAIRNEVRPIADFTYLAVTGEYQVQWRPGAPGLSIAADENILPRIRTVVSNHTLDIDSLDKFNPTEPITIILSSPSLTDLQLTGEIHFEAGQLSGRAFRIASAGDSDITIGGSVRDLDVTLTGAANLHAKALSTRSAKVTLTGSPSADITVSQTLTATLTGAGMLTYSGNPKTVHQLINGAGAIQRQ